MSERAAPAARWLIDGFNLLHASLLNPEARRAPWWDRAHREAVLRRVAGFEDPEAELVVVFDGSDPRQEPWGERPVQQVFAPSADAWLVRALKGSPDRSRVRVVSDDREVADRARDLGARVVSTRDFLRRCAEVEPCSAPPRPGPPLGSA